LDLRFCLECAYDFFVCILGEWLESGMIYDMRTYTFAPGNAQRYLKVYEELAYALQLKHQRNMVGFWQTDIGPLNNTVSIWAYESLAAREEAKAALGAEPGWKKYLGEAQPLILSQQNTILKPAPFFMDRRD
jgi:hypothetical protein